MGFVADTLADGRTFRTRKLLDDRRRECVAIEVGRSIPVERLARALERLRFRRGLPEVLIMDNELDFSSLALDQWPYELGVGLHFIQPSKPVQNALLESLNG